MMKRRMILFNGPRHSGKDTAANFVWAEYAGTRLFKMSRPLKDGIKAFFNLDDHQIRYLESKKTEPDDLLFGYSYVEVQISMSEHWAKEYFGSAVFGKLAARELGASPSSLFVCSDSGFDYEAAPLLKLFRPENTLLVRLHRPGKTFEGDSRSYIELPNVMSIDLQNNGELHHFYNQLRQVINAWLNQ